MRSQHRRSLATYVATERHLMGPSGVSKTLTQIAREIGTTKNTVRRWLRRDHWDLWIEHWASVEEIWEGDGDRSPVDQHTQRELRAFLAQSLAEIEAHGALV
jgi:predicted transcriptional regulator